MPAISASGRAALAGIGIAPDMRVAGMLTQGGRGGARRPAPLASQLHRIPTHFLLNSHGI